MALNDVGEGLVHDRSLLGRCFRCFILPVLEYCSAVWCSAADTHLRLLDRVVSGASFLTGGAFHCDLAHRRSVAVLFPNCLQLLGREEKYLIFFEQISPFLKVKTMYAEIVLLLKTKVY